MAGKPPSDADLSRVAEYRANGFSWVRIAKEMGRSAETLRGWTSRCRRRWKKFLSQAEDSLISEASAEAVLTLRDQLRSEDEKIRRDAAQRLIQLRIAGMKMKKPGKSSVPLPDSESRRIATYLGGLTDAEIQAILGPDHCQTTPTSPASAD